MIQGEQAVPACCLYPPDKMGGNIIGAVREPPLHESGPARRRDDRRIAREVGLKRTNINLAIPRGSAVGYRIYPRKYLFSILVLKPVSGAGYRPLIEEKRSVRNCQRNCPDKKHNPA
jgi:hypothetical protein